MKKYIGKYKKEGLPGGPNEVETTMHGFIVSEEGQWKYPGQPTLIPSNEITMQGVDFPVLGIDDTGHSQMMMPGADYTFPGSMVYELPMAQNGKSVSQKWREITGTSWSKAKELGLTTGGFDENLELQKKFLANPEYYKDLAQGRQDVATIEPISVEQIPQPIASSISREDIPIQDQYRNVKQEEAQNIIGKSNITPYGVEAAPYTISDPRLLQLPTMVTDFGNDTEGSFIGEGSWNRLGAVPLTSDTGEFAEEYFDPLTGEATGEFIPTVRSSELVTPGPNAYKRDMSACTQDQCSAGMQYNIVSHLNGGWNELQNKLGIKGDAWTMNENILNAGGQRIYGLGADMDINRGKNYSSADIRKKLYNARKKYDINKIYESAQVGDIIEMYYPNSDSQNKAIRTGKGDTYTTHVGHVTEKDGVKYVTHNVHETWHTDKLETLLKRSGTKGDTRGTVVSGILRPDYGWRDNLNENKAISISTHPVQAIAASGDRNYYTFGPEDKNKDGKEDRVSTWQNKAITPSSKQFVQGLEAVAPTIAQDFGLSNDQLELIIRTSFAALGKESSFGEGEAYMKKARARKPLRTYKKLAPDWLPEGDALSEGMTQIKVDEVFKDPKTKALLNKYGIKSEDQLYDPMYASIATMILGALNYKQFESATGLRAEEIDPITMQNIMMLGHNKGMQNVINKDFTNEGELKALSFLNKKGNKFKEGKEPTLTDASILRGLETYSNAHMNRKSYTNEGGDFAASLNIDIDKLIGPKNNANYVEYEQQELPEEYGLEESLFAGAYNKVSSRDYHNDRNRGYAEIEAAKIAAIKKAEKLYSGSKRKLRQALNKIERDSHKAINVIENAGKKAVRKVGSFEEGGNVSNKIYLGKYTMGLNKFQTGAQKSSQNKIPTWLNPYNWGVPDYTDKYSDKDAAFSAARKAGEKEYLYNGIRYPTDIKGEDRPESSFNLDRAAREKIYNSVNPNDYPVSEGMDALRRYLNNEKVEDDPNAFTEFLDPVDYDAWAFYMGVPQSDNSIIKSKYKPGVSTDPNISYYTLRNAYPDFADMVLYDANNMFNRKGRKDEYYKDDDSTYGVLSDDGKKVTGRTMFYPLENAQYSKGKDERGNYIALYDEYDFSIPFESKIGKPYEVYDRIYYKDYGNGKEAPMYYTDKELSELDPNKKNFDTLALQKELANRGYDLSKSMTKDDAFDGVWGDETKAALLDWQKKQGAKLTRKKPIRKDMGTFSFETGGPTDPPRRSIINRNVDISQQPYYPVAESTNQPIGQERFIREQTQIAEKKGISLKNQIAEQAKEEQDMPAFEHAKYVGDYIDIYEPNISAKDKNAIVQQSIRTGKLPEYAVETGDYKTSSVFDPGTTSETYDVYSRPTVTAPTDFETRQRAKAFAEKYGKTPAKQGVFSAMLAPFATSYQFKPGISETEYQQRVENTPVGAHVADFLLPLAPDIARGAYKGLQTAGRALGPSEGLLSNASKLNPKAKMVDELAGTGFRQDPKFHYPAFQRKISEIAEQLETPEGRSRLQALIENNPHLQQMNKSVDDIINDFKNTEFITEAPKWDDAIGDWIKDSSGKLQNFPLDVNNALNWYKWGTHQPSSVWVGQNYTPYDAVHILEHEFAHLFQRNKELNTIDDVLYSIKSKNDPSDKTFFERINKYNPFGKKFDKGYSLTNEIYGKDYNSWRSARDYWGYGNGRGQEKAAFVAEIRENMMQRGLLQNRYDKITPDLLKQHYRLYNNTTGDKYNLRLYDIMKYTKGNFKRLSDVLNRMPAVLPAAGVVGAGAYAADKKQYGGVLPPDYELFKEHPGGAPYAYNAPQVNGVLLPDPNRPQMPGTNATEYKTEWDGVTMPSIVNGVNLGQEGAFDRYLLTGEHYPEMLDPESYSKFYNMINELGLMQYGTGGLKQWFDEDWRDIKTGKKCGRGKDEKGRPYPACRPSKRVSPDTPKTTGEMSPEEKSKFRRKKRSSKRISYNHKRNNR